MISLHEDVVFHMKDLKHKSFIQKLNSPEPHRALLILWISLHETPIFIGMVHQMKIASQGMVQMVHVEG